MRYCIKGETRERIKKIFRILENNGYKWSAGQRLCDYTSLGNYSGTYMNTILRNYICICSDIKKVTHAGGIDGELLNMEQFIGIFGDIEESEEEIMEENNGICYCCGDMHDIEELREGLDGNLYCNDCYWETFDECNDCGRIMWRDNSYYVEREDICVCEYCYDNYCRDNINGYHCGGNLTFLGEGDSNALRFGFELEVNHWRANWARLDTYAGEVRDILGDILYDIQEDGSILNGFEIISNPMTYDYYVANKGKIEEMLKYLQENEFQTYGDDCGVHIHITRQPLENADEDAYENMHYIVETFKDSIIKYAHRSGSRYASYLSDSSCISNDKISEIKKGCKMQKGERYLVINNNPHNTIELRMFKSSILMDDIDNYMTIANGLANAIIKKNWTYKTFKQIFGLECVGKSKRTMSKKQIEDDLKEIVQKKLEFIEVKDELITRINARLDDYYEYITNNLLSSREGGRNNMDREFLLDYRTLCDILNQLKSDNRYTIYMNNLNIPTYVYQDSYKYRIKNDELLTELANKYNELRIWN